MPAGPKVVIGKTAWDDYTVESAVMLRDALSNANLVVRVEGPQGGNGAGRYEAGFDTRTLYLGKTINGHRRLLTTHDLSRLECSVEVGVWNQIRVHVNGNRIRVWFNRMHPSADPEKGLRIDYTDTDRPILSVKAGVQAAGADVWYDNLVFMPSV